MNTQATNTAQAFDYYVTLENGIYVLRQPRFRHLAHTRNGEGHPHDICAYARTADEMRGMVENTLKATADFSAVA